MTGNGQMSFDDMREMVINAIRGVEGADNYCYIEDLYPDAVVYCSCGKDGVEKYYRRSYSIVDDKATLGDAVEVKEVTSYEPVQAAASILTASGDDKGSIWDVRVIAFGPAASGTIVWEKDPLVAALDQFDGAKVFALNDSQHQDPKKAPRFGKSARELVGALTQPEVRTDGIYARLVILPSASWLQQDLCACRERNIPYVYGLSVDVSATTVKRVVAGKQMTAPARIGRVEVDVVYNPDAKGEFLTQLAAARAANAETEDDEMKRETLVAALQKARPQAYAAHKAGIEDGTVSDEQILTMLAAGPEDLNDRIQAAVDTATADTRLQASRMVVATILAASGLPEQFQAKLRKQFNDAPVEESVLQAAIQAEKECIDSFTGSGNPSGVGTVRAAVGRESGDKLQAAFDGMVGVTIPDSMRDVPVFTSLRAAYVEMTGDTDVTGVLNPQQLRRMQAAYGDTSFAYALGNSLYRRLVQDYREMGDYGVSRLVGPNIRNATDFRKLESIRIGYYGDLPDVDTDAGDYPDLGEVSDEKVEYALNEKGGTITINRRMIINDDLRVVQKIVSRLPRAARRTLAKRVWNLFIANGNYLGDSKAIFHADHANLGASAYAIATALTARQAMFDQTEPGSGEKLGLRPVTVAFPSALYGIVHNVNNFNPQAVTVDNGNSMFGFFRPEGLIECPFFTDANDWYMFADPNEVEIVELAFLNGQQEPQMLVADNPAVGQMFVGGRIQYRINHDYECACTDYRGAYKAVVA